MDDDDRLLAYVQNRLTAEDATAFETELQSRKDLQSELAAIRAWQAEFETDLPDPSLKLAGWERLSQAMQVADLPQPANDNRWPRWTQLAGVAAAAVLAWQFAIVPMLPEFGGGTYTPASQVEASFALRIAFEDTASLAVVQNLLQEIGATIVDGPSAVGLYTLSFEDETARERAHAVLAGRDDVISTLARP